MENNCFIVIIICSTQMKMRPRLKDMTEINLDCKQVIFNKIIEKKLGFL